VILQTYSPLHPVVEAVQRQDYAAFAQQELSEREALRYPPFSQLILLRMSGPQEAEVEAAALKLAQVLGAIAPQWEQLGPVPAVVARVARLFRWQIMLRGTLDENPGAIAWEEVRSHCPRNINLTVDVDPLNFW
jgi:primosomal protein N' (replication factor Y)